MRALGVAVVACCGTVFWPSAAHANPIGIRECATMVATAGSRWQAFVGDRDSGDRPVTAGAAVANSSRVGTTGTMAVFDDHGSLGSAPAAGSSSTSTETHSVVTVAVGTDLVASDNHGNDNNQGQGHAYAYAWGHDNAPGAADPPDAPASGSGPSIPPGSVMNDPPSGGAAPSATPEPASLLLIATGLAGLFVYRRQLFA